MGIWYSVCRKPSVIFPDGGRWIMEKNWDPFEVVLDKGGTTLRLYGTISFLQSRDHSDFDASGKDCPLLYAIREFFR